jgi:hypothetical protein
MHNDHLIVTGFTVLKIIIKICLNLSSISPNQNNALHAEGMNIYLE